MLGVCRRGGGDDWTFVMGRMYLLEQSRGQGLDTSRGSVEGEGGRRRGKDVYIQHRYMESVQ